MVVVVAFFCQDAAQFAAISVRLSRGVKRWLHFVEIAGVRWRMVRDFARSAERA
jgi:hypothetical protein